MNDFTITDPQKSLFGFTNRNIWYRPMNVEPYKDKLGISNDILEKKNLEISESEESSSVFTVSTTNKNLLDDKGTNCSNRKNYLELVKITNETMNATHKFVFKTLKHGFNSYTLVYKSGPKIEHNECGRIENVELVINNTEEIYYLWAISFPNNDEDYYEFGDITKLYLYNEIFNKQLSPDLLKLLTLNDINPEEIYIYNAIQTSWTTVKREQSYNAHMELSNILCSLFKFNPNNIYTTPEIVPFVIDKDEEKNARLILQVSLDTDITSNFAVTYFRVAFCIADIIFGGFSAVTGNYTDVLIESLTLLYRINIYKSNKLDAKTREKLLSEGVVSILDMETIEIFQYRLDALLDKHRKQYKMIEPKKSVVGGKSKKSKKSKKPKKSRKSKKTKRKTTKRKSRKSKR